MKSKGSYGGSQLVTRPLAKGTLPTYPLDSISTNFKHMFTSCYYF